MYRRILYRPDGDPAPPAGGGDPKPPKTGDPAPPAGDGKSDPPAKMEFSSEQQAHIDSLITKRVEKAEKSARQKAQQEADEAARRAQMDETERLKAEKKDAEDRATEAEKKAQQSVIASEARIAVMAAGAKADRVNRILGLLDLSEIAVTDGAPDSAAITKAVNELKGELPELFVGSTPGRSGADMSGQGKPTFTTTQIEAMKRDGTFAEHEEEILAAMREGRIVR